VIAAAHETGGGLVENVPRALPDGLGVEIRRGSWSEPAIFALVREAAGASDDDMLVTFNMGIGLVLVVPADRAEEAVSRAAGASVIGRVTDAPGLRLA
jgi:phosphoribosylformylglycinamidine cyclo-ligase